MPKAIKVKTNSGTYLKGDFDVLVANELNFFDLTGERASTKGSSNKSYHAEVQISKDKGTAQIFTMYGPTGGSQSSDYRWYCIGGKPELGIGDISTIEKDYEKILSSKRKKGYKDIDVAQRSIGSDGAKQITKTVILKNADSITKAVSANSLHKETARIISTLMGATNNFVIQTLKCPLGQLTNKQIDDGRVCLDQAKVIVQKSKLTQDDEIKIRDLTNEFYGLIPHNLGSGARGQLTHLLLDTKEKIDTKEYDLDMLLDAKAIGATLVSDSVYDQYQSLDTEFNYIDSNNTLFSWLNAMIQETRAHNHKHLGKIKLLNAWSIQRAKERDQFLKRSKEIAKECGRQVIPDQMQSLVRTRADVYDKDLFRLANVIPLFHGTRTQNITGILKKGMLIRPSGAIITGAMYDGAGALYFGKSTKSINYTDIKSSYWAKGSNDRAFLFISDCSLGNQLIARGPYGYTTKNISPKHSVWARGGESGVINDEMMLYRTDQHNLRYLLEFSCE